MGKPSQIPKECQTVYRTFREAQEARKALYEAGIRSRLVQGIDGTFRVRVLGEVPKVGADIAGVAVKSAARAGPRSIGGRVAGRFVPGLTVVLALGDVIATFKLVGAVRDYMEAEEGLALSNAEADIPAQASLELARAQAEVAACMLENAENTLARKPKQQCPAGTHPKQFRARGLVATFDPADECVCDNTGRPPVDGECEGPPAVTCPDGTPAPNGDPVQCTTVTTETTSGEFSCAECGIGRCPGFCMNPDYQTAAGLGAGPILVCEYRRFRTTWLSTGAVEYTEWTPTGRCWPVWYY